MFLFLEKASKLKKWKTYSFPLERRKISSLPFFEWEKLCYFYWRKRNFFFNVNFSSFFLNEKNSIILVQEREINFWGTENLLPTQRKKKKEGKKSISFYRTRRTSFHSLRKNNNLLLPWKNKKILSSPSWTRRTLFLFLKNDKPFHFKKKNQNIFLFLVYEKSFNLIFEEREKKISIKSQQKVHASLTISYDF